MSLTLVGVDSGVAEHRFEVPGGHELIPGLLWRPAGDTAPLVTVLIGHGRTTHKRNPHLLGLARGLAARGWNAVAIDAPGHGERRAEDALPVWPRPDPDETAGNWQAALDFLREEANLGTDRLAYWGLSMGTALGISLIAREQRIGAAVLGLMHPNWPSPPGTRIRTDAARITCPVLFLINWEDSLVPRSQAFELYETIGSTDKRLLAYPGDHGQLPHEATSTSQRFLARSFRACSASQGGGAR